MLDKFKDECGVFGIFGHPEAANLTYLGLFALQHRGQESAGIAAADGGKMRVSRAMGEVAEAFDERRSAKLPGHLAIGHTRYSTAGESKLENAQPFVIDCAHGQIAVAHNGNLVNAQRAARRPRLERLDFPDQQRHRGHPPLVRALAGGVRGRRAGRVDRADSRRVLARAPHQEPSDCGARSERLQAARARPPRRLVDRVLGDLRARSDRRHLRARCRAWRDRHHFSDGGLRSIKPFPPQPLAHCVFEHVYFARPDSYVFGRSVNEVRTDLGRILAREAPVAADVVVPIPDSGVCAAIGYAEEAGLPMKMGLIRNHYVGRTFIQPQQSIRHFSVKVKLNPVRSILEGKRVVLIDDSIVRGTTSRKIVKMVKAAGAQEVHLRISCPPTISPCFYGVDTPSRNELIAATHTTEEIREFVEADSLAYLSLDGLRAAVGQNAELVLHVLLHGRLSGGRSPQRACIPAARAQSCRIASCAGLQSPSACCSPRFCSSLRRSAPPRLSLRSVAPNRCGPRSDSSARSSSRSGMTAARHDSPRSPRTSRCPRCSRRPGITPTATSASVRSSCSRGSTIRGRATSWRRCSARRTIACDRSLTPGSSTIRTSRSCRGCSKRPDARSPSSSGRR